MPVKSSALSGNDSLLSIVQMPRGVPVATVAIGNAANAGLLAVPPSLLRQLPGGIFSAKKNCALISSGVLFKISSGVTR